MSAEQVAVVAECVECGAWLPGDEERWQLREVDLDAFAWYCWSCAEREFGGATRRVILGRSALGHRSAL